ncbi:hypothetical protein LCGC14_0463870 [marine sediment metagenome]|uniref:Uncharacterized protein n=1 Tax=marine sediment metagenome TaxID=412755 RepID=A0A0F9SJJ0_9ZZZZ
MKAIAFKGHNVKIAEKQEQYETLPAYHNEKEGSLIFCFELDNEEKEQVKKTGRIYWKQITGGQPMQPVGMTILKPESL